MLKTSSLLLYFLTFACFAKDYYRWVDKNGVINFSDKPPSKAFQAQKLSLPLTHTSQAKPSSNNKSTHSQTSSKKTAHKASKIAIISPSNEETIRNNQGIIDVKLNTNFPLAKGQYVQLVLNGKKLKKQNKLAFKLENIDRGSHLFRVLLIEADKILASSKEIVVFLHRTKKGNR